ncbi:MAG TPA: helix-turn-helix domain-containing protein [Anaerolineae bacterium]|jgi:transcriptional regulator with XRE-family HTH domain|nr:helix-turn-helix domain-containing protein [Anaerolineae bacterium]
MQSRARVKLVSLVEDMGSQAQVARALDVDRSRVSRWLADEEPDRENLLKLEAVEFVLSRLRSTYQRSTAMKWLFGFNAHLGNARPIDLLTRGRVSDVLRAIEADETGAYA